MWSFSAMMDKQHIFLFMKCLRTYLYLMSWACFYLLVISKHQRSILYIVHNVIVSTYILIVICPEPADNIYITNNLFMSCLSFDMINLVLNWTYLHISHLPCVHIVLCRPYLHVAYHWSHIYHWPCLHLVHLFIIGPTYDMELLVLYLIQQNTIVLQCLFIRRQLYSMYLSVRT